MKESLRTAGEISDAALWVVYFRARGAERSDPLFRDPYAANSECVVLKLLVSPAGLPFTSQYGTRG